MIPATTTKREGDEVWDESNGVSLCKKCHEKTDSYPKNLLCNSLNLQEKELQEEDPKSSSPTSTVE